MDLIAHIDIASHGPIRSVPRLDIAKIPRKKIETRATFLAKSYGKIHSNLYLKTTSNFLGDIEIFLDKKFQLNHRANLFLLRKGDKNLKKKFKAFIKFQKQKIRRIFFFKLLRMKKLIFPSLIFARGFVPVVEKYGMDNLNPLNYLFPSLFFSLDLRTLTDHRIIHGSATYKVWQWQSSLKKKNYQICQLDGLLSRTKQNFFRCSYEPKKYQHGIRTYVKGTSLLGSKTYFGDFFWQEKFSMLKTAEILNNLISYLKFRVYKKNRRILFRNISRFYFFIPIRRLFRKKTKLEIKKKLIRLFPTAIGFFLHWTNIRSFGVKKKNLNSRILNKFKRIKILKKFRKTKILNKFKRIRVLRKFRKTRALKKLGDVGLSSNLINYVSKVLNLSEKYLNKNDSKFFFQFGSNLSSSMLGRRILEERTPHYRFTRVKQIRLKNYLERPLVQFHEFFEPMQVKFQIKFFFSISKTHSDDSFEAPKLFNSELGFLDRFSRPRVRKTQGYVGFCIHPSWFWPSIKTIHPIEKIYYMFKMSKKKYWKMAKA